MCVWDVQRGGEYFYSFRERVGEVDVIVVNDRYVVVVLFLLMVVSIIYLWDFGVLQSFRL